MFQKGLAAVSIDTDILNNVPVGKYSVLVFLWWLCAVWLCVSNRDNCTKIGVVLCDFPTGIRLCFVLLSSLKKNVFDWGHGLPLDLSLEKNNSYLQSKSMWTDTGTFDMGRGKEDVLISDAAQQKQAHNVFHTDETNPNKPSVCTFYHFVHKVTLISSALFQLGINTYLLSSREFGEKISVQKIWGRGLSKFKDWKKIKTVSYHDDYLVFKIKKKPRQLKKKPLKNSCYKRQWGQ